MSQKMYLSRSKVILSKVLGADIYRVDLYSPQIAQQAKQGQFLMINPEGGKDIIRRLPLSIADVDKKEGILTLIVKKRGKKTSLFIENLNNNKTFDVHGPLGNGFQLADKLKSSEHWLFAGGIGVASILYLARALSEHNCHIHAYLGARTAADICCKSEMEQFGVEVFIVTEDGSMGKQETISHFLIKEPATEFGDRPMIYACGPKGMLKAVASYAIQHEIPAQVCMEEMMA